MGKYTGKTAVVTGGAGNPGFKILKYLMEEGANVAVLSSTKEKGLETVNRLGADKLHCISDVCDVTDKIQVKEVFHKVEHAFGGIDFVFCFQGWPPKSQNIIDIDDSYWENILSSHLTGCFHMLQQSIPFLEKSNSARVVFLASQGAENGSGDDGLAYTTAKGGIIAMSQYASKMLADKKIMVNYIVDDEGMLLAVELLLGI